MSAQPAPRNGFWGSIFRTGSLSKKPGTQNKLKSRRLSEADALTDAEVRRRRRAQTDAEEAAGDAPQPLPARRAPQAPSPKPQPLKGIMKVRPPPASVADGSRSHTAPPPEWPPAGSSPQRALTRQHALSLVAKGAPEHKGHKRPVPHASDHHYALYTTTVAHQTDGSDGASLRDSMTQLMTLRVQGPGHPAYPWETLEQPSCAFCLGKYPGTITLNHWASMASVLPPTIAMRDSGVVPRPMTLARVLERLMELQSGLEDDDERLLYRILYKRMLRDPDKGVQPHRTLDKQITDLILVLSRPDWIDFSSPRNQVVTRFIFDGDADPQTYHRFYHQLLLSLELELRIQSRQHGDWAKEKLLRQIPPRIQWGLALARRWREHVRVDDYGDTPDTVRLRYKLKKRQVKVLRRFGQVMKWPNLAETLDNLKSKDEELRLDSISSDAFAFFSGLVLPGPTLPFLMMNALIDLDPDPATDELALLSHMHPHCGFQYRNSYSYWASSCIVGKVMAPACRTAGGWIGPGRPTADLNRSQMARIRSRRPRQRLTPQDVESMSERSGALGPPAETYPVDEYGLATADSENVVDTVRVERLGLKPVAPDKTTQGPRLFDATVQFAIDGISWPLRLTYDVSFIAAWPCSEGPHPLFFDYLYERVRVDDMVGVRNWGRVYGPPAGDKGEAEGHDDEKVLVVEAFGVSDCEVLARAWCAHWGLSAVVADVQRTCVACAVREAYAATVTVVILIDERRRDDDDDET